MRILYSVAGEGMGHATRSKVVIEHLSKKHDVYIATSGRSYSYLSSEFEKCILIQGLFMHYKNNSFKYIRTFLNNSVKILSNFKSTYKLKKLIKDEKIDLVITDFEPFSVVAAKKCKVPIISVDNQQALLYSSVKTSFLKKINLGVVRNYIRRTTEKCNHFFVSSFFPLRDVKSNVDVINPILRKELLSSNPINMGPVLVYQTSISNINLIKLLKQSGEKFLIYGYDKDETDGNLTFRKFDEKTMFLDLSTCKAVITNGGFSLITEAINLKKPILCEPVKNQFEQMLNAQKVKSMGYGEVVSDLSLGAIKKFMQLLDKYKKNYGSYTVIRDNNDFFKKLDKKIEELTE